MGARGDVVAAAAMAMFWTVVLSSSAAPSDDQNLNKPAYAGVKEFLYAQNGLAIYEALSFDVQRKGVPTLHLFSTENSEESYHRIVLADFSFDELHLLMSKLGLKKKPDETIAAESEMANENIRAAFEDWKRMTSPPGGAVH